MTFSTLREARSSAARSVDASPLPGALSSASSCSPAAGWRWGLPESVSVAETLKPLQELNDESDLEELKALMATSMVLKIPKNFGKCLEFKMKRKM